MSNINENQKQTEQKDKTKLLIILAGVLVVSMVAAIFIVANYYTPQARIKKQLKLADQYIDELEYEQAIAAYRAVIEIDPKEEAAYLGLVDVYEALAEKEKEQGNYALAQDYYNRAIEVLDDGGKYITSDKISLVEKTVSEKQEELQAYMETTEDPQGEKTEDPSLGILPEESWAQTVLSTPVGETVTFGKYASVYRWSEYGDHGENDVANYANLNPINLITYPEESIEWYVIKKDGKDVWLLSKYILDTRPFNYYMNDTGVHPWDTSEIRSWLNDYFYNAAFSAEEKIYIKDTSLETPDTHTYDLDSLDISDSNYGGGPTVDKVFLLSQEEIQELFHLYYSNYGSADPVNPVLIGRYRADGEPFAWLLRSPGSWDAPSDGHSVVAADGYPRAENWPCEFLGIRPVIVLTLE